MSNSLVTAFLTQIDLVTARKLFAETPADLTTLNLIIDKLIEQQAIDKLSILLTILNENELVENSLELKVKINLHLLIEALNNSNTTNIVQLLQTLKSLVPINNQILWQTILSSLIHWIENHQQQDDILLLLHHLPPLQRERLYSRLLETADGKPFWLSPLVTYIVFNRPSSALNKELNNHLSKLASYVLLSPVEHNSMNNLTLTLSTEQLVNILFQLRAIAATYASDSREKQHHRFTERRQIYLSKYDALATALTVRATHSQAEYGQLIYNNTELANILMIKRLKGQLAPNRQKELVIELLTQSTQYDRQDPLLKTVATNAFLTVFSQLCPNELSDYFKKYYSQYANKNLVEIIRFLDLFLDRVHDKATILKCINDIDDEDKIITINFITTSKSQNRDLTEDCLERLDEKQLINLCGHIVALRQIIQNEHELLSATYYRVLAKKISQSTMSMQHLLALAKNVSLLSDTVINESITHLSHHFKSNSMLRYQWLTALFLAGINKATLLQPTYDLLKLLKMPEQLALLRDFSSEELLALYQHMLRCNAAKEEFNCLAELLKETSRQPLLLYLLLNAPLRADFLDNLMPFIDDKNLITLIDQFIDKIEENKDCKVTFDEILKHFCQRLQTTTDARSPLHHWVDGCQQSPKIAFYLLNNPTCFYLLASRSSIFQDFTPTVLQGYLVSDAAADLKLRANRVLNLTPLTKDSAENVALHLLSQFQTTPKKLQTLFSNLEAAQQSLDSEGRKSYCLLKEACWHLLNPKASSYEDKRCVAFLTTQLGLPHCFDPLLVRLAVNISQGEDAHLSAQYLVQIEATALEHIAPESLALILTKSIQEKNLTNWQKVITYLNSRDIDQNLYLVKNLILHIKNSTNPFLTAQAMQFITRLDNFEKLLPQFNQDELQWFFSECNNPAYVGKLTHWFQLLVNEASFEKLNYSSLLVLLPLSQPILESIYKHEALKPHLQTLFLQLASLNAKPVHFIMLFNELSKDTSQQKREFITKTQLLTHAESIEPSALFVINMLLLTLDYLNPDTLEDIHLVLQHLQLITKLSKLQEKAEYSNLSHEFQQLILNTFSYLIEQNSRWPSRLLVSQEFAQIALVWINKVDTKTIERHPFTKILLQHAHLKFHETLTQETRFQEFIKQLLAHPPETMNEDQFAFLFEKLSAENQKALAYNLLQQPTLGDVQWSSLMILAQALPATTLYSIYAQSKTRFVFVDLLARHHSGLTLLSNSQKNTLIADITSGKQILRILDSYSSGKTKISFVEAIFNYLETQSIPLTTWLESMNVDSQTLAAFANYTTNEKNKQKLGAIIKENHYYERRINEFLQNPAMDLPLEPGGLLFSLFTQTALNPWKGWLCQFKLLPKLPTDVLREVVQNHFELFEQLNQLIFFLEPLNLCQEVAPQMLQSARWFQSLPLLTGVLKSISLCRSNNSEFRDVVSPTALYQQIVLPLFQESYSSLEIPFDSLYNLLIDYSQTVAPLFPAHAQTMRSYLLNYQHHLQVIENYSAPKLIQLFRPDSYFGKIKNGQLHNLQKTEIEFLSTAGQHHKEWISAKQLSPAVLFAQLLTTLLQVPEVFHDQEFRQWLLNHCLFSPIAEFLSENLLQSLLSHYPAKEFEEELANIYQNLRKIGSALDIVKKSNTYSTFSEVITTLYSQSIEALTLEVEVTTFAHLPHLSNLLGMLLQAKKTHLSQQQVEALLLPTKYSNHMDLDWFHMERGKLSNIEDELIERCRKLAIWGFSANNDSQNLARLTAISRSFIKDSLESLAYIFNAYQPLVFDSKQILTVNKLIHLIDGIYADPQKSSTLLKCLNPAFLKDLTCFMLKNPKTHESLLRKIIYAGFGKLCQSLIDIELNSEWKIKRIDESQSEFIEQLSPVQFANLTKENCEKILILQHFLFTIKAPADFEGWHPGEEHGRNYALFCADAALYKSLLHLQNVITQSELPNDLAIQAQQNLEYCFHTLTLETKIISYNTVMEKFHKEVNTKQPGVYFHWLRLFSFLIEDSERLISSFLSWLLQTDDLDLEKQPFLEKLLLHILNHDLFDALCKRLSQIEGLTSTKANWLFAHMAKLQASAAHFIPNIVLAFSWDWLKDHLQNSTTEQLILLDTALHQEQHIAAITANTNTKLALISILDKCQFVANDLINLQKNIDNKTIKSLISAHLLGRKDYIEKLQGESFLSQLSTAVKSIAPRLHPLAKHMHLAQLPSDALKQLHPEAAATLFCSIKDFHHLNETYAEPFLHLIGEHDEVFIKYWLTYFGTLPNSETPLITLANIRTKKFITALTNLADEKKRAILSLLVKHQDKLGLTTLQQLTPLCEEAHLNYAVYLYLYKGQAEAVSIQFILDLTDKLLEKKAAFSSQTIQLLMRLSEGTAFSALRGKLGRATSDYLRSSALFADCSLFYDEGHLNIKRMQKLVPLHSSQTTTDTQHSFLQVFTKSFKSMFIGAVETTSLQLNDLAVNPLIDLIMKKTGKLQSFDYFLIHYQGKLEPLQRCFNDYLDHLAESHISTKKERLQTLAWLLTRTEMKLEIREILFNGLLSHPQLFSEEVSAALLLFDCKQSILRFGMSGDYKTVINLCKLGLTFLETGSENKKIAERALQEAQFESSIHSTQGFLAEFRVWIKRSFFYGWETWWEPKKPHYVLLYDSQRQISSPTIIFQKLSTTDTVDSDYVEEKSQPRENLETILARIDDNNLTIPVLITVVNALAIYDWQKPVLTEIDTRKEVDDLFTMIWQRSKWDQSLATWLSQHFEPFLNNRRRLIGLYLQNNQQEKLTSLLLTAATGPGLFHDVAKLLLEAQEPELVPNQIEPPPCAANSVSILNKVTSRISSLSSYFWTTQANTTDTPEAAAPPPQQSWFFNLFGR
ncbi:hypothetical protein [Legionella hackeliae]|uniref:Putative dot/icm effector n=1 Tax=Legionella hackeliae TaxID=449 RepID=A0A0A8UKU7_LEGHA|nr:hypothetical protein [Legionella hackeliae]KTD14884.1 Dot/Icm T4SS effector [Legionella hackeliae]CEK09490.1 putative dot/icm effector [Legionella hackeliae]STX49396.1 Dot/Icm secretion system substrate [Legionella hackeliae]